MWRAVGGGVHHSINGYFHGWAVLASLTSSGQKDQAHAVLEVQVQHARAQLTTACSAACGCTTGFHHASTVIKLQALSKKATLRGAAAQQHQQAAPPPAKKQRQLAQPDRPSTADAGLLDAATGAFVHGSEDDLPRVSSPH